MADLLVRGIDDDVVQALKERASLHGRTVEAEHKNILVAALARPQLGHLTEVLAAIPNVGTDADFERVQSATRAPNVFD
jgi:plasmid stability protein